MRGAVFFLVLVTAVCIARTDPRWHVLDHINAVLGKELDILGGDQQVALRGSTDMGFASAMKTATESDDDDETDTTPPRSPAKRETGSRNLKERKFTDTEKEAEFTDTEKEAACRALCPGEGQEMNLCTDAQEERCVTEKMKWKTEPVESPQCFLRTYESLNHAECRATRASLSQDSSSATVPDVMDSLGKFNTKCLELKMCQIRDRRVSDRSNFRPPAWSKLFTKAFHVVEKNPLALKMIGGAAVVAMSFFPPSAIAAAAIGLSIGLVFMVKDTYDACKAGTTTKGCLCHAGKILVRNIVVGGVTFMTGIPLDDANIFEGGKTVVTGLGEATASALSMAANLIGSVDWLEGSGEDLSKNYRAFEDKVAHTKNWPLKILDCSIFEKDGSNDLTQEVKSIAALGDMNENTASKCLQEDEKCLKDLDQMALHLFPEDRQYFDQLMRSTPEDRQHLDQLMRSKPHVKPPYLKTTGKINEDGSKEVARVGV